LSHLTERDRVRLLVGDTDDSDPLLTDDEIDNFIEVRSLLDSSGGTVSVNVPAAGADAAAAIAAQYAREFDFSEDGQNFARAQRVGHYLALAKDLRARSGGIAVSLQGTVSTT
jgi:hypothetical protein